MATEFPVVCPVGFDQLDGVVLAVIVAPFDAAEGTLPLILYTCLPTGSVTVSVKEASIEPLFHVVSTGPDTTTPFESTNNTDVKRPVEAVEVAKLILSPVIDIASHVKSVKKPPRTWLETLTAIFCAATSVAFPNIVELRMTLLSSESSTKLEQPTSS